MLDLCRICLLVVDQPSCINVHFKICDHKSILEVMQECSSIQLLEEDNLPKNICIKCREKLDSLYKFRNLIIKSDAQLKNQICIKIESISSDESADNVSEGSLPWTSVKVETKEEFDSCDKYDDPLAFDADLVKENLKNLLRDPDDEKTIKENVSKGTKRRRTRLYKCKECNLEFKSTYSLENHNQQHTGVKPFSCEFCGKGFLIKSTLKIHRRVHTGDKPYTCDFCQKTFRAPSSLYIHQKIHKSEKRFFCEVCNKGYYQSCQLGYHMRLHTGEKPYMCEVCSKMFRDHNSLVRHREAHEEKVEKLPCPICGRIYKRQRDVQNHMKRHNGSKPFVCSECGQTFTMRTSLSRHKLLHSGVKPHKCKVCEKSFSQSSILMRHMRIHSGEKPFPCTLCPKEFAYKHHLQGHMRIYHQDAVEETIENEFDSEKVDPLP